MNLLDLMASTYEQDNPAYNPMVSAGAASVGEAPDPVALMAQGVRSDPQVPQGDHSMLPALALLRFAAAVGGPRRHGENTSTKILGAMNDAAGYAMQLKGANNREAMEREAFRQKLLNEEQQRAGRDLTMQGERQRQKHADEDQEFQRDTAKHARETRPLQLEQLRLSIENAKDDKELKALELRVKRLRDNYSEQFLQAELEEKNARTVQARSSAAAQQAHARLYQTQAEHYLDLIETKKKEPKGPKWTLEKGDSVLGTPDYMVSDRGDRRMAPMAPADALRWASAQTKAQLQAGDIKPEQEKNTLRSWYQKALKGEPLEQPQGAAPPSGSPSAAPQQQQSSAEKEAIAASLADPKGAFVYDDGKGTKKYYIGGKEVTKEEVSRRMQKPGASGDTNLSDVQAP